MGLLQRPDELPPGRFRDQLERLTPTAKGRAMQWLQRVHFPSEDVESMHADREGGIFYSCDFSNPAVAGTTGVTAQPPPVTAQAAVPISPFPSQLVFNSRPGAPNVIYLNFVGESVADTAWNTSLGRTVIPAVAFSTDSDYVNFSDSEQTAIKRIWQRVSEDYALFDVNVTTARPSSFTLRTAMALITRSTDENGALNPGSGGGIAYINVFAMSSYAYYRPAWIYINNLANNDAYIAEAVSHEVGHNMGLSHDGTSSAEYYGGHGSGDISWGPIMGTGYNQNVSQWSKGEYYQANNTQDDLSILAANLSYRPDDRGDTRPTATPLVISGGTDVRSTTPEDDPTNSDKSNKGVLERGTDVDVFSFVTGSGPVNLAVNPWVTPSGTRGGNVDLLAELYDEAGTLLIASNDPDRTGAVIGTTLAQGRYYLYVKNSGAGNPLVSPPTGYTAYASLGQYFVTGTITASIGFVDTPLAVLQSTNLTQSGQAKVQFSVTYSNSVPINVSTIDSSDIRVTGPNGYDQLAGMVSLDFSSNGTPRTATYQVTTPGGGNWSYANNGTYQVTMRAGQVNDAAGTAVAAGLLGEFNVSVPVSLYAANMDTDPGWTLQPAWQYGIPSRSVGGPTSGYTGTRILGYNLSGNYANGLTPKFATTPIINTSGSTSLTLLFKRWLRIRSGDPVSIDVSTDGVTWINVWSTSGAISDTSWQSVQYSLPAGVVGSSTLRMRWGLSSNASQNDIGWNIDDVELTGTGSFESDPPQASLSVAGLTLTGQSNHSCSVIYTDATAVRLNHLDSTDLLVTGPNGYSRLAGFVGASLSMNGSPLTGSYTIPAPNAVAWNASDNGIYTVNLRAGEIEDILGNVNLATTLGTFTVGISAASPGALAVASSGNLLSSGMVGGPFSPGSVVYTLSNPGGTSFNWSAGKTSTWVDLSATGGSLAPGASTTVTVSLNAGANALAANTYSDTVSFTNLTNGSGDANRSVTLTINTPGTLSVAGTGGLLASGTVGGPFSPGSVLYTLTNPGGVPINWSAGKTSSWVDLSATGGSLAPGASTTVTVSLNAGVNALAAATYNDTVSFTNLTNGSGSASRSVSLTINSPGRLVVETVGDLLASGMVGGPFSPGSTIYTLSNPGGTPINWSAGKTSSWVDLSAAGGSLAPGASTTVTVSLNVSVNGLAAATYSDTVSFINLTNGSGDAGRSVSLTINTPGRLVVETVGDLLAIGMLGGPFNPGSVVYTLTNSGGTSINWTAANTASWVDLSAISGNLAAGASTMVTVSLDVAANSLVASTYNDTISFGFTNIGSGTAGGGQSAAAVAPVTRGVILKVLENIKVIGQQFSEARVFEIVIQGTPNMLIALEGTTDFIEWTKITSGQIGADGTLTLRVPESVARPTRFYRAYVSSP